jgi:acyl-CoA reductase-like NAD-dependent aldehyde dehydrogenase
MSDTRERNKLFIDGEWSDPQGAGTIEVINPATEQVIGHVPEASGDDVDHSVRAARRAFASWSTTAPAERADWLQKIHEALAARADLIAETISAEVGMPLKLSRIIQAGSPIATFKGYARMIRDYKLEEEIGNSLVVREPAGVVACITPWNYPLHQIAAKVAPALAAGCTVVLKPSEVAPLNAFLLADAIAEAGLPAGVFNLVCGYGPKTGEALVTHPEVDMISFTGSTRAGTRISELAAKDVKRVTLELGGKSASVILDDADLRAAIKGTIGACFINSGQTCSAHTRMLVPAGKYAEAAAIAVEEAAKWTPGDPMAETSRLGPLVSRPQYDRVRDFIRTGIEEGAELLTGGAERPAGLDKGYFVPPTVFGKVAPDATIAQQEIFGPVLSIITYEDEDEAVEIANDTVYGLAGGVWSGDPARAERVARRMRTGQVDINGGRFNPLAPFGGYKRSGHGRELGVFGLEEYFEIKAIQR